MRSAARARRRAPFYGFHRDTDALQRVSSGRAWHDVTYSARPTLGPGLLGRSRGAYWPSLRGQPLPRLPRQVSSICTGANLTAGSAMLGWNRQSTIAFAGSVVFRAGTSWLPLLAK